MLFNGPKNSSKCFTIQSQQFTIGFGSDTQRSRHIVDQCHLSEMFTLCQGTNSNKTMSTIKLMELEALKFTLLNNIKLFTMITLFDNNLAGIQTLLGKPVNKFELLELVKTAEQFDTFKETKLDVSLLDTRLNDYLLE